MVIQDYMQIKAAILDRHEEAYWHRFHHKCYRPKARLRAVTQRLKDTCRQWLRPESQTGPQLVEFIVLEQFIQILPPGD